MPPVARLVFAYAALATTVPPDKSRTAALIRGGDSARALERLRAEIAELAAAFEGSHAHRGEKGERARRLLGARGLDAAGADLLLEASQVSYWWLVAALADGRTPDARSIAEALAAGAAGGRSPFGEEAAAAARRPSVEAVYGLIGRALAGRGLPPELFAELDLQEMSERPYLREALRGA